MFSYVPKANHGVNTHCPLARSLMTYHMELLVRSVPTNGLSMNLKDLHLSTDQLAREQRAYKAFFSIMKSPPISCHKGYNRLHTLLAHYQDKTHIVGCLTPNPQPLTQLILLDPFL